MNVIADAEAERRAPDAGSAADCALVHAAMLLGRQLAGSTAHDLNSTLQCVGDALFAIREDARALVSLTHGDAGGPSESLDTSLTAADEAFSRLITLARAIPELVPRASADARRVDLARELHDVVAVTRTLWKNRVDLSIDVAPGAEPFACVWWIARMAATTMILSAAEAEPRVPQGTVLPRLRISGGSSDAAAEIRVRVSRSAGDAALPVAVHELADVAQADATLALCARRLGGEVQRLHIEAGVSETVLTFPIQRIAAPSESGFL